MKPTMNEAEAAQVADAFDDPDVSVQEVTRRYTGSVYD